MRARQPDLNRRACRRPRVSAPENPGWPDENRPSSCAIPVGTLLLSCQRHLTPWRFTDRAFGYAGYQTCDLAYAITGYSAQGGTVHTGIALVTGGEDRQWLTQP